LSNLILENHFTLYFNFSPYYKISGRILTCSIWIFGRYPLSTGTRRITGCTISRTSWK
jgi:hypothetical protein